MGISHSSLEMSGIASMLPDWLTRCAENAPDALAVRCGLIDWSFNELAQQAIAVARQLATPGIGVGSRVALLAANGLAYVACVHALTHLGAILIPLNTRLTDEELRWQLKDVRADLLLSDSGLEARAREIVAGLDNLSYAVLRTLAPAADSASIVLYSAQGESYQATEVPARDLIDLNATQVIMYTSGTTGRPKGVLITYGMQWWNAIGSALNLGHQPGDRWLACLPLFHIGGLAILMRSVIYGISVILHEKFDAGAVNRSISQDKVTIISVVAVMLQRMLSVLEEESTLTSAFASLRCVLLGGGPAPLPLLEKSARLALPVVQTYGLTESCSQAVTLAPSDALRKPGSAGRPLLPVQLQIRQENTPQPANAPGIIYLKGPSITPGYANRPDATAEAFSDGWFSTGDVGYLVSEGYLYVLDRRSDLIVSGGENIYPAEVESVLMAYPDVVEAGVCGRADAQWGQVPVAFLKIYPGRHVSSPAILAHCAQYLAKYKVPRNIYFVEELPRNSSGKLLRRELRHLLTSDQGGQAG